MTSREKQRERDRRYKERNVETLRARAREYQRRHQGARREEKRAYMKKYYEANRDTMRDGFKMRYEENKEAIHSLKKNDPRKRMLSGARSRAREKNLEFSITMDDVHVPVHCPLLGIPIEVGKGVIVPGSPSLDRKDNTKGYVPGNVWVVSWRANMLKRDATSNELLTLVTNLRMMEGLV